MKCWNIIVYKIIFQAASCHFGIVVGNILKYNDSKPWNYILPVSPFVL